ncbi:MAG: small subunit ribosomal protein [Patescibacteria group bacterium]|nr:small subunit ribosomal protein [Patescibacteria group bacterium]
MSKTKKSNIGHYEVLFIVPNRFTEEEAKQVITAVEGVITKNNGEIDYREYWGKKKLAYEIKHNAYGYYALAEFNANKEAVALINQELRLSNDVIRHQIISKHIKSAEEIAKAKVIQEKINARKKEEAKELKEKNEKEENDNKKEKNEKEEIKTDKKSNAKELEQKLEGILNAKDLI